MAGIVPLGHQTGLYDSAFMGILQDCVKLPQFLDSVFSFLARRTDFYIIMEHEKAKMGFPHGVSEGMVIQVQKQGARARGCSSTTTKQTVVFSGTYER